MLLQEFERQRLVLVQPRVGVAGQRQRVVEVPNGAVEILNHALGTAEQVDQGGVAAVREARPTGPLVNERRQDAFGGGGIAAIEILLGAQHLRLGPSVADRIAARPGRLQRLQQRRRRLDVPEPADQPQQVLFLGVAHHR